MSQRAWRLVLVALASALMACSFDLAAVETGAAPSDDGGLVDATSGDDASVDGTIADGGSDVVVVVDAGLDGLPKDVVANDTTPPADTGIDAGPIRVASGIVALYTLKEGAGTVVHDTSGVAPALDLTITDPAHTMWVANGLRVDRPTIIESANPAAKVISALASSNQLTLETWITPSSLTTTASSGRIIDCARPGSVPSESNFDIAQVNTAYGGSLRVSNGGATTLSTPAPVTLTTTHYVLTRDTAGAWVAYINGASVANGALPGSFATFWEVNAAVALGNNGGQNRPWLGTLHLAAIYSRPLTAQEVQQNYNVGF